MKYKCIGSALRNFADSFTSDANVVERDATMAYLARRAICGEGIAFRFDIIAGKTTPAGLAEAPVASSIETYAKRFAGPES